MTLIRLARHRREASSRGVLPDSVLAQHPRPVKGTSRPIVEYRFKSSGVTNVAGCNPYQPKVVVQGPRMTPTKVDIVVMDLVKMEATTSPVLHPRPRYIYGDVYAPVYRASERDEVYPKSGEHARLQTSVVDARVKSRGYASAVGWPYARLVPSMAGVNYAREVLVMRAINKSPTRMKRAAPPRPSSLRFSLTRNSESALCSLGVPGPGDLACLDATNTNPLGGLEEQLVRIINNANFVREGDGGVLSPSFSQKDVPCMFESQDNDVVSYIDGPFSPEQEKQFGVFSVDNDDETFSLEDYPEIPDEFETHDEAEVKLPVWVGRRVTFAEPPRTLRSAPPHQCFPPRLDAKLRSATKARWDRLRSSCAALVKRKLHVA